MKIKRKVQKNLPQFIEWLLKSGYRNYTANSNMGNIVTLSRYGAIQFSLGTFFPEETFTVEIEEEITEDTEIPKLVSFSRETHGLDFFQYNNSSINEEKDDTSLSFYIMNDDYSLELIWTKEKGLVE